jgi:hypothetical protein
MDWSQAAVNVTNGSAAAFLIGLAFWFVFAPGNFESVLELEADKPGTQVFVFPIVRSQSQSFKSGESNFESMLELGRRPGLRRQ